MKKVKKGEAVRFPGSIVVKNIMSASVTPSPEGFYSRLAYWEEVTGEKAGKCAHEVCEREATEGAMARRAFSSDRSVYVFPACETCARRTEMLYVSSPLAKLPE